MLRAAAISLLLPLSLQAAASRTPPPHPCNCLQGTADRLLAHRKLLLILDLDHTLLNSTRLNEIPPDSKQGSSNGGSGSCSPSSSLSTSLQQQQQQQQQQQY